MDRYEAQETKALAGGTLPHPLVWADGGGQLPYSHVVVDVSGSMQVLTDVPNHSGKGFSSAGGPHEHTRMEYVYFLLRTMLKTGAITKNTKLYPMGDNHPEPTTRFVSAGMVLEPSASGGPWETYEVPANTPPYYDNPRFDTGVGKIFYEIFAPKFGSSHMNWVNKLPHTKTLLITDVGSRNLPGMIGGTWVVNPEYKQFSKSPMGATSPFSGVKGWIENTPLDIIGW